MEQKHTVQTQENEFVTKSDDRFFFATNIIFSRILNFYCVKFENMIFHYFDRYFEENVLS